MDSLSLRANGISFRALAAGPESGPLVLLLHGFPELSISWEAQLAALGQAGYRAIAPDMRGYGQSDRTGPYDLHTLTTDIKQLIGALGRKRAAVVGHDWGGAVAWATAILQPESVERLSALNCPHPLVLARALLTPRQLARSWYMFFFQLPALPELLMNFRDGAVLERGMRQGSSARVWTEAKLRPYRDAMAQPGAATAAIGYYRAVLRNPGQLRELKSRLITAPTQVIWGLGDPFLGAHLGEPDSMRSFFAPGNEPVLDRIAGAGHFVQNEAPERVNEALLRWLSPMLLGQVTHAGGAVASS